jgi:hypothetical protein
MYLDISDNQLTGAIPSEMGNLTNLVWLDLSDNQLTGTIPTQIGTMSDLMYLDLSDNQLTGVIPAEIGNLTNLADLYFSNNQLTGAIPVEIGNLIYLDHIRFNSNKLSGSIPISLTNLMDLTYYGFYFNALYTYDESLISFLNNIGPTWELESTQTIAPVNVSAKKNGTTIQVSWSSILYNYDPGGYIVSYSEVKGGPYTVFGTTADKTITQMVVTGLNPEKTYYFVVQSKTEPHEYNKNTVISEYSKEVKSNTPRPMPWLQLLLE